MPIIENVACHWSLAVREAGILSDVEESLRISFKACLFS